jgi:hypothetical protein
VSPAETGFETKDAVPSARQVGLDEMSGYGQGVHQRYPTGDVVVSVRDLAERLGNRADAVAKALHLLLTEQKVQKARLKGYWKLNP